MDSCWYWAGSYFPSGYGQVWSPSLKRPYQAHRWVYEELVGPIPEGLQIDHLCRVRGCVNPKHLRVVTGRENIMAPGARCLAKVNVVKTVCPKGHAYDAANTYTHSARRQCRICKREVKARSRESAKVCNSLRNR